MSSAKLIPSDSLAPITAKRILPCGTESQHIGAEGTASLDASTYCFVSNIPGGVFSKDGIDICAPFWLPEHLLVPPSVRAQKQRSSSA